MQAIFGNSDVVAVVVADVVAVCDAVVVADDVAVVVTVVFSQLWKSSAKNASTAPLSSAAEETSQSDLSRKKPW